MNLDSREVCFDECELASHLAAAMSSLGLGGLCFPAAAADPFVPLLADGACVIGIVVCVVEPEFGLLWL